MGDEPAPTWQKEYWHDKRPVPTRTASSPGSGAIPQQSADRSANSPGTPSQRRTYRNLGHPIASFVLTVLVVILVSVGLLAATGGGALPVPLVPLADCAQPTASLLGVPGAQFTAAFPAGTRAPLSGPAANDWCSYAFSEAAGDSARPLGFHFTATLGQAHIGGWGGVAGSVPDWASPSELQHTSRDGAAGLEAFRCDETTDWCYGWLRVSRAV